MKPTYFNELEALCRDLQIKVNTRLAQSSHPFLKEISEELACIVQKINLYKIGDQFAAQDFVKYALLAEVDEDKVNSLVYSIVSLPRVSILAEIIFYLQPGRSPQDLYDWLYETRRRFNNKSAVDLLKDYAMSTEMVREVLTEEAKKTT